MLSRAYYPDLGNNDLSALRRFKIVSRINERRTDKEKAIREVEIIFFGLS